MADDDQREVADGLKNIMNRHGYAFEQAVIQMCHFLHKGRFSPWRFVFSECPIHVHGEPYHIDIVLEHVDSRALMAIECKRVDPARSRWGFVRRAYTRSQDTEGIDRPVLSVIHWEGRSKTDEPLVETPHAVTNGEPLHLAFELKTQDKGDGVTPDRGGSLNSASSQAFRGATGLIERMRRDGGSQIPEGSPILILPAIVTTATLWVSRTDVSTAASLETGNLDHIDANPIGWLWFQQNLSRHLRPATEPRSILAPANPDSLERATFRNHTRAVAVVNVNSLQAFLRSTPDLRHLRPV